jgi:putative transposase
MPRKPRIEYPGAIYHIMSRGNRSQAIFGGDQDYQLFLHTLDEACTKTGWRIHAFVLMNNHYHLLLETPEANLVTGMKWLQGTYTQRYNSRHKQWGHLLQGRYKALLVDGSGGEYFLIVSNYIHLNPVRAKMFDLKKKRLADYRWSSYPLYFRPSKRPVWLAVDRTLGMLRLSDDRKGRKHYRSMMHKKILEIAGSDSPRTVDAQWAKIRRGWYFGTEAFRDKMVERLDEILNGNSRRESFSGKQVRLHDEQEALCLLKTGLRSFGIESDALKEMKKSAPEKQVISWYLRTNTIVSNRWVADQLHCGHPSNVSAFVGNVKKAREGMLAELREILISKD